MARFKDLPEELLGTIVCFIPRFDFEPFTGPNDCLMEVDVDSVASLKSEARRDLYNLIQTCSSLYRVSFPHLYAFFTGSRSIPTSFLRTVVKSKKAASYVKHVTIWEVDSEELRAERHTQSDQQLFIAAGKESGIKALKKWQRDLNDRLNSADVELLLKTLPNIETLCLNFRSHERLFKYGSFDIADIKHTFSKLSKLRIQGAGCSAPGLANPCTRLLYAPLLQTLSIANAICSGDIFSLGSPARQSPITNISILRCDIFSAKAVWNVLHSCRSLKRYTFDPGLPVILRTWEDNHILALRIHRDTLETIAINALQAKFSAHADVPPPLRFSFVDFSCLRTLKTHILNFINCSCREELSDCNCTPLADLLPPSLEELFLYECTEQIMPHLNDLSKRSLQTTLKLHLVKIRILDEGYLNSDVLHSAVEEFNSRGFTAYTTVEDYTIIFRAA